MEELGRSAERQAELVEASRDIKTQNECMKDILKGNSSFSQIEDSVKDIWAILLYDQNSIKALD